MKKPRTYVVRLTAKEAEVLFSVAGNGYGDGDFFWCIQGDDDHERAPTGFGGQTVGETEESEAAYHSALKKLLAVPS